MPLLRPRVRGANRPGGRHPVGAPAPSPETFISAIVKWIPVEVIGVYQAISVALGHDSGALLYLIFGGAVATAMWIAFATYDPQTHPVAWRQIILSSIAFLFWTSGTEDPARMAQHFAWWTSACSLISLAVGTLALPILDGILKAMGIPQD